MFTTRPDTLFGATFMVLAPEHPLVDALTTAEQAAAIAEYRRVAGTKSDVARQVEDKTKTGVFTGSYATNPVNGAQVPVWIADYVLMGYGTGAIMAVPCGDERDFEFARQFGLPIPAIQQPPAAWFEQHGIEPQATRSTPPRGPRPSSATRRTSTAPTTALDLDGLANIAEAKRRTNEWLSARGCGEATISYKLRDWLFSRQRYWGEPFPIVYDERGHAHTLPDELLPLELPPTDSFSPRTFDADDAMSNPESPLDRLDWWTTVELDLGDGPKRYRRDTNVMPQWAGCCWYELRYCDPTNENAFVDREVEQYWMGPQGDGHPGGVDLYVGGVEHAVLHLLYARFWHKVLFDLGHLSSKEPYHRLFNQGYILAAAFKDEREIYVDAFSVEEHDGQFTYEGKPVTREWGKMGKSLKNAVAPDDIYEAYGADTLRLYEMAMGPLDASRPWETRDVVGMYRFLQRVWRNLVDEDTGLLRRRPAGVRRHHRSAAAPHDRRGARRHGRDAVQHRDRQADRAEQPPHQVWAAARRDAAERIVLMLAPLAPHMAEELWRMLGHDRHGHLRALPHGRPGQAGRGLDRAARAGERQGAVAHHRRRRCRCGHRSRPWPWPTPRWSPAWRVRPRRRSSSSRAAPSTSSCDAQRHTASAHRRVTRSGTRAPAQSWVT